VKVVVVKIGYLEPELHACAGYSLLALTPGAVNQEIGRLPYRRLRRPIHPLDLSFAWSPQAVVIRPPRGLVPRGARIRAPAG
jgi:microcystin degradation protein MlrC